MLTEHQKKQRKNRVGSSEIAMLVIDKHGQPLSPFGGPHTLWRRKMGLEPDDPNKEAIFARGNFLEPAIARWWAAENNTIIRKARTRVHHAYRWCVDSCDYIEYGDSGPVACVEVKTGMPNQRWKWGEDGTDGVPLYYATQGQWHCGHHGLPVCKFPVFDGWGLRSYMLDYDPGVFWTLAAIAERFVKDYLETGKEPPADGHESTHKWLGQTSMFDKPELVPAEGEVRDWLEEYRSLTLWHQEAEDKAKVLEARIKQAIGGNAGLYIPGTQMRVTYGTQQGRSKLDVDGMLADLGVQNVDELKKKHTKRGADFRVFRKDALLKNGGKDNG